MAIVAVAVLLGSLTTLAMPADATEQRRTDADRKTSVDTVTDQRPDRDLEVLTLACRITDRAADATTEETKETDVLTDAAPAPSPTRVHIGCRWRAAQHPDAAGYQLWRIVDRGHRELVARGGLDLLGARDVVSAKAHLVRYAVVAVNEDGRRVGQSRVVRIRLDDDQPTDRTARLRRHNAR